MHGPLLKPGSSLHFCCTCRDTWTPSELELNILNTVQRAHVLDAVLEPIGRQSMNMARSHKSLPLLPALPQANAHHERNSFQTELISCVWVSSSVLEGKRWLLELRDPGWLGRLGCVLWSHVILNDLTAPSEVCYFLVKKTSYTKWLLGHWHVCSCEALWASWTYKRSKVINGISILLYIHSYFKFSVISF